MHFHPAQGRVGCFQPPREDNREVEPRPDHRSSASECCLNADRSQPGIPRQCGRERDVQERQAGVQQEAKTAGPEEY